MSERSTADRNQCLTYMMREEGAFEPDVDIDKVRMKSNSMFCGEF